MVSITLDLSEASSRLKAMSRIGNICGSFAKASGFGMYWISDANVARYFREASSILCDKYLESTVGKIRTIFT